MSSTIASDTPTLNEMTSAAVPSRASGSDAHTFVKYEAEADVLITPDIQPVIKNEPPEDIDDTGFAMDEHSIDEEQSLGSPKIRLTPTVKLMPSRNPVDPKRKFVCPYEECTKSYGKSSHLRSHLTWHTGIKPFVCKEPNCGKGFTRSDELNRHVRTHTGEKPFECVQCTKKFSRSDHLTKHLGTHAKQMQGTTKRQRMPLEETAIMESAVARAAAHRSDGPEMKKVFMEMQNAVDHMQFSDGMHFMAGLLDRQMENSKETEEKPTDDPAVSGHMPIKIKLEKPKSTTDTSQEPSSKAASSSKSHSSNTTNVVPVDDNGDDDDDAIMPEANAPPPLQPAPSTTTALDECPIPNFENIQVRGTFDVPRPYPCRQCTKSFKRQDDLNRHLRTHTGEKPFPCSECDRRFMRRDHLNKHLKTHTRLR